MYVSVFLVVSHLVYGFYVQFYVEASQTENWLDQQIQVIDSQLVRSDVTAEEARKLLAQLEVLL